MYLTPYWSWEPAAGGVSVVNQLSGRQRLVSLHHLNEVASAFDDPAHVPSADAVDVFESLEILFRSKGEAEAFRLRDVEVPALPYVDQIELTNRCPYTCQMCPRTTEMTRELGTMDLRLFESIIDQISGSQRYTALHHFGESLLHPNIDQAVKLAHDRGVFAGLSCNPPTLTPNLSQRLLEAGLANMVLSLDSLDSNVYRSIRGHAARLDRADEHVRRLVAMRDDGGFTTWITLQMISMRVNDKDVDAFLRYCASVGVDRGVVVRLGRWDFDDDYIGQIGDYDAPGYTAPCGLPNSSVVILWDGRVVPCCHDYNGQVVLGNARTQTLSEIWTSSSAKRFREMNDDFDLCRKCAFSPSFKEAQRSQLGLLRFHRRRDSMLSTSYDWINPASEGRSANGGLFDRFDVLRRD